MPNSSYICPHCEHVYNATISTNEPIDSCSHLLCYTLIVSKINKPYQSVHDFTANLMGVKVPIVVVNRFIRFLRDKNAQNPQGFYTIQQSRTRISNTFQGITSFTLNQVNDEEQNDVQYTYYLTSNPLNDISYFESFILKNYIEIFALITASVSIDCITNQQQQQTCTNGIQNSSSDCNNNNSDIFNREIVYVNISNQQMQNLLKQFSAEDEEDDEDVDGRWVIVHGIPNQIPTFIWISPTMEGADNIMLPIKLMSQHTKSALSGLSIKISPIIKLPSIAMQI